MCIAPHINSLGIAIRNLENESEFFQGLFCGVCLVVLSICLGLLICYLLDKFLR